MVYILNGISVGMLNTFPSNLDVSKITLSEAKKIVSEDKYDSLVSRKSLARDISNALCIPINTVQKDICIETRDIIIIVRYAKDRNNIENGIISPSSCDLEFYKILVG